MQKNRLYVDPHGLKWKVTQVFPDGCALIKCMETGGTKTICKEDFDIFCEI